MHYYRRAIAHSDADRLARQNRGLSSAAHGVDMMRAYNALGAGEWPAREIERLRSTHYAALPASTWANAVDYVRAGRNVRERQERLANCVLSTMRTGTFVPLPQSTQQEIRAHCEALAVNENAHELTQRLEARDQQRDRHSGIDERARAEQARRASTTNPDTERRAELERSFARLEGEALVPYAHVRRELIAQQADRNVERYRSHEVRDADPYRLPDRADDRRDDIALAYDSEMVNTLAADELALRDNPALEATDYALTHAESRGE